MTNMSNDEIQERINLLKEMAALEEETKAGNMGNDDLEERIKLLRELAAAEEEAA